MAWSFVGVSTVVEVATTSHTLTLPTGTQDGDLLVAVISSRIASTTSITLPAGWTRVTEQKTNNVVAAATTGIASAMMAYIVRGTATPSLVFTHPTAPSVAIGRIVAYRGGAEVSPLDTQSSFTTATAVTAVSGAGLTTTAANDLIVMAACGGQAASWTAFDAVTDPTTASSTASQTGAPTAGTWLERADTTTATGADTSLGIADAIRATAGATGNLTVTASLGAGQAVVAGAFKIATTGFVAFAFNETNTSGTTTVVTLPEATKAGDVIVFAGFGNAATVTVKTNNNDTGTFDSFGGAVSPRTNSAGFFDFVGRIIPTVGSTSVTLTQLAATAFKALGCWIVRGWPSLAQDKGVWTVNQTGTLNVSGLTGTLTVAAELAIGFDFAGGNTTGINLAQTGSGAFRHDAIAPLNNCAWSHQITSTTGSIQSAWTQGSGGGDTICVTYLVPVTGTLVEVEDVDVAALTGAVSWQAALVETEDADVAAMTGIVASLAAAYEVTDNFDRANGGLGANWTSLTGPFRIASNAAESGQGAGGQSRSIWTANNFANNQYAEITVANTVSGGSKIGPLVRGQPGADSGYYASCDTGGAEIFKVVAGTSTSLNWAGITMAIGDVIRLEVTGSTLVIKQNGVTRNTITDSTFASGYPGIFANFQGRLDNFLAGPTAAMDDFNRANGGLGANWAAVVGWNAPVIDTNKVRGVGGGVNQGAAYWAANSFANDQYSEATLTDVTTSYAGLCVRMQPGINGYTANIYAANSSSLYKWVNGVETFLGDFNRAMTLVNGDVMRLEVVGATLTLKQNGVTRGTINDSTHTSGQAGVYFYPSPGPVFLDNWTGGPTTGVNIVSALATTEAADTAAINATVSWQATLAAIETVDVLAATATVRWAATLATIETGDVAAGTGTVSWQATLATTETADAGVFNGTVRWAATLAAPETADAGVFNGAVAWAANLATTEIADTAAITGAVRWIATLAASETADTAAFTGATIDAGLTGTLGVIETPDVAGFTGGVAWAATLAVSETADVAALNATVRWAATLATTEAPDVAALTGVTRWAATLATTEAPDVGAFTGGVSWQATLAAPETADIAALTAPRGSRLWPLPGARHGGLYGWDLRGGQLTVSRRPMLRPSRRRR
jgi:hypothetical protein